MKVEIDNKGNLKIVAENGLESFALTRWFEGLEKGDTTVGVDVDGYKDVAQQVGYSARS